MRWQDKRFEALMALRPPRRVVADLLRSTFMANLDCARVVLESHVGTHGLQCGFGTANLAWIAVDDLYDAAQLDQLDAAGPEAIAMIRLAVEFGADPFALGVGYDGHPLSAAGELVDHLGSAAVAAVPSPHHASQHAHRRAVGDPGPHGWRRVVRSGRVARSRRQLGVDLLHRHDCGRGKPQCA